MFIYYFEFVLIGLLWLFNSLAHSKTTKNFYKIIAYGSLLFLTCFRSPTIDPDTPMYLNYFNLFHTLSWTDVLKFNSFEIGSCVLFKLIGEIWFNENFFIFIMSFITMIPIFIFIDKKSKNIYLSLLVFLAIDFWFGTMYIMRQYTAMSFCLLALLFIDKKPKISFPWFLICTIIATFFHITAIFFLPVYFFKFFKVNWKVYLLFISTLILFISRGEQIVTLLNTFARVSYDVKYTGGSNLLIFLLVIVVAIPILNKGLFKKKEFTFYYLMLLYATLIQALAPAMENMTRAARYAMIVLPVIVPNFFDSFMSLKSNVRFKPIFNIAIFVFFALFFVISIGNHSISEYSFFWE